MEQRRASWSDEEEMKFRRMLVWHRVRKSDQQKMGQGWSRTVHPFRYICNRTSFKPGQ